MKNPSAVNQILDRAGQMSEFLSRPPLREGGVAIVFLALVPLIVLLHFYFGTLQITQINPDRSTSDQQHNMQLARETVEAGHWFPSHTRGVVNPLWPWLSGRILLSNPAIDDAQLFRRGKFLNLTLTGIFLVGLAWWSGRTLGLLPALLLPLLGSMAALAQRAPYFQPEPLYYMLLFLSAALAVRILRNNRALHFYALLGFTAGLAYLAKSAITPMLAGFFGITLLPMIVAILPRLPGVSAEGLAAQKARFTLSRHLIGSALLVAVFSVVILPRALSSAKAFGDPFHSFPKYWMWQDDFGTESTLFMQNFAELRQRAAEGDETALPSAANYARTHSTQLITTRLQEGFVAATSRFFLPEKKIKKRDNPKPWRQVLQYRGLYLAPFAGLAVLLAGVVVFARPRSSGSRPARFDEPFTGLILFGFVLGTFLTYALSFGWYEPIGKGDRFMLSLYLPLLAFLIWACENLRRRAAELLPRFAQIFSGTCLLIYALTLYAVLARIVEILAFPWFEP